PLSPDLEGDTAVFLHRDGDQCGAFRGDLLNAECETEVWTVSLAGGAPSALTTVELPRAQLQVSEGTAVWAYLPNTLSELLSAWNVAACPVTGCPSGLQRVVADRPLEGEYMPYVADGVLSYFVPAGPIALELGTDQVFGAAAGRGAESDDVPVRLSPPLAVSLAPRLGLFAVRHQHHNAEGIVLRGGVVPMTNPAAVQSQSAVALNEDEEETMTSLMLDVDASVLVDSPIVTVEIDVEDESGIDYELISPAGTRVVLGRAEDVETRFSVTSSPGLLGLIAEPLAGEWTLVIVNGDNEEGTVSRWRFQNGS
ncbi:MAG: proprotein convertase P-domain-containing protein, partial [Myxococcota bacterium]